MKKFLIIAGTVMGVAVVMMVVVFLYINRGDFIQAHVLPVVEERIGESVTAEATGFSLFRGIEFKNFQIGAGEPIARADTIRVAYAFSPLLRGNVEIEEILVDQLDVKLTDKRLEKILNNLCPPETAETKPAAKAPVKVGAMPGVFVKSLKVKQLNFEFKQLDKSGAGIVTTSIHDLNVDLSNLGNDRDFSLNVKTRAGYAIEEDTIDVGDIIVIAKGKLDKNLLPAQMDLEVVVDRTKGSAAGIAVDMESMRYKARIDLGANASSVALDGKFALNRLNIESTTDKKLKPTPISVTAGHKLTVDLDKFVLKLDTFDAAVGSEHAQLFSMNLSNSTEINLANPNGADAALTMMVNLDNRSAGQLIPKIDDVRIRDWALRTEDLSLSVKNGKDVQLKGAVVIDRIDVTALGTDYTGLAFRDEFKVECRGMRMISEGGTDVLGGDVNLANKFTIAERSAKLVDVNITGNLQLNPGAGKLYVQVASIDLSHLAHLLPPLTGIEKLKGKVRADIDTDFTKPGKVVNVKAKASLIDMDVAIKDKGRLARPVSIGVAGDLSYTADGMLGVNSTLVNVTGKNREYLAEIKISGSMDALMKARKSELLISSDKTIEGDILAGFWVATQAGDTGTADKSASISIAAEISHQAEPATLPPLWIDTKFDFADIKYKDLRIKDLMADVTLKDNQLALKETSLKINQGSVKINADCDLKDLNKPGYKTEINIKDLSFDPFMTSFTGLIKKLPMKFAGGFKNADINVQGSGYKIEDLQKNLFAEAKVKFSSFRVKEFTGLYGKTIPMLMNVFKLEMDDLAFDDGDARIEVNHGKIKLLPAELSSGKFSLNYQGEVELGGNWRQDLKLQGTLSPDFAERVPEYVQLANLDNGMSQTNVIPLKGDLTKPGTIVGIIGSACVKPEYREEAELIAALASGEKPKAKDVLEKGLKLGIKKYFEKEDAGDDRGSDEENSDKNKVKDLLKSLF
ncbi:MAG: DUF748 domain-containing protein [Thermodesulfobacteriota bacterium]|nr:DUF748 domain-containing protein [Thermodesulfobacteriota bacterium]